MTSIQKRLLEELKLLDNPKRLYRYAEREKSEGEEIIKDVQLGGVEDIVVIYPEKGEGLIKAYQGVYTGDKLIGVRVVEIEELSLKGLVEGGFYSKSGSEKLQVCKKYMRSTTPKAKELVFLYERVE